MIAATKRKSSRLGLDQTFEGLKALRRGEAFKHKTDMKNHIKYYEYEQSKMIHLAEDYLLEDKKNNKVLPFLPTLVQIQKCRMDPELFGTLEGKYYQWKYQKVLKEPYICKSDGNGSNESDSDSESESDSDSNKTDNKTDNKGSDNMKESIRAPKFARNFLNLKDSQISLELKKGSEFVPWVYFKTVKVKGKKTIGMFAGRNFPAKTAIGFYISHPWFKWVEAFTETPPESYDEYLQGKHLLPEDEAEAYMWFYDDEGFMTACDPVRKPPDEKGKLQTVPRKRILGMGFHLVNVSQSPNISLDDNGCVKTTMQINVDTELVMIEI
jgi:hypothetical protein